MDSKKYLKSTQEILFGQIKQNFRFHFSKDIQIQNQPRDEINDLQFGWAQMVSLTLEC